MKNPLRKRIFRELKEDFSKYLVIFLFMTLTIGFISGFLVAAGSMKTAYDESFEKYNIEDGHFVLDKKADNDLIKEIEKENVVISIAPGITIKQLKDRIGFDARIVRAMPNTPALVGEGMTGVAYNPTEFNLEEKHIIEKIFKAIGKMKIVNEKLMSAVTCASGSSPAYVFMFIEALADGAVRCGMSRQDAYEFAAQTVYGSAKMVLETKAHPGILKDMVCSPAGTTIDAVKVLEDNGFRSAIMKATEACFDKCENIK